MSLEDIREQKTGRGVYIVIGLLLVGMAGFGTQQFAGLSGEAAALTLGDDIEVSESAFTNALNDNRKRYAEADDAKLQDLTVSQLRQSMAFDEYLTKYPLAASNKMVDGTILNNPAFFENGKFSEAVFRRYIKVDPSIFRRSISNDIAKQSFQNILGSTAVVSDVEITPYVEWNSLSRDILVAKISRENFKNTATAEEIKAFFDKNKDEYLTEEQVNVEYVELNPEEIIASIEISKGELESVAKPQRNVNYYVFKTIEDAKAVREDLANAPADKIDDSGKLNDLVAIAADDSLVPQLALDAIFALSEKGKVTNPVEVDGAIYLFELTSEPNKALSDKERNKAKLKLQSAKAAPQIATLNEKLNKAVFESTLPDLVMIAEETGLTVKETGLKSILSGEGALAVPEVVEAIQASDKATGKLQEPVTAGERVVIYRLVEIKAPEQKLLKDVKTVVEKAVIADKTNKQMAEAAKSLIEEAKKEDLTKAATAKKYPVQAYANFVGQVEEGVLDAFGALLIANQPPVLGDENMTELKSMTGDVYVYTNTQVRLSGDEKDKSMQANVKENLVMAMGKLELTEFFRSIASRADVKMRTGLLKASVK